jgi:glyceraldehyde 3-phosphate dehydrogenase
MTIRVGINGFGRMGRLLLRAAWECPDVEFIHINDPAGDAATFAHLLSFDSIHGRWSHQASGDKDKITVGDKNIAL